VPASVEPVSSEGVLLSACFPASPKIIKKMTKKTAQANSSYLRTAFRPMNENTKPQMAQIMTPSSEPTRPSDTADRARPPVIQPTEDQPS